MNKIKIEKDILHTKYLLDNLTVSECASFFGCGKTTIIRNLSKFKIKKPKELKLKNISKSSRTHDYNLIKKLYLKDNLTRRQIADKLNIKKAAIDKAISIMKLNKSKEQKRNLLIKVNIGKNELYNLYVKENKSVKELSNIFKCGVTAIYGALKRHGITKPKHLQAELTKKAMIKSGRSKQIQGLNIVDLSNKYNMSRTPVTKFIKNNSDMTDIEKLEYLEKTKFNSCSSLELKIHKELGLDFYNKSISGSNMAHKPDFKLDDKTYMNVDGLYWHSELKHDKNYHMNMRKEYEKHGLRLLQFREDEINYKFNIVKSIINNILGKSKKVFARNTKIKQVQQKEATVFLNNGHLMGSITAKHIGLYDKKELVMLISYKMFKNKVLKIERMCAKPNFTVVGGFSKLIKYLETQLKPKTIQYWVDLRYGIGTHLLNKGFKLSHETLGWKWTDFEKTYNRRSCRANMDDRKLSEREQALELELLKIYDAGQRLFVKEL